MAVELVLEVVAGGDDGVERVLLDNEDGLVALRGAGHGLEDLHVSVSIDEGGSGGWAVGG